MDPSDIAYGITKWNAVVQCSREVLPVEARAGMLRPAV
jgi:hypothetical protein